MVLNKQFLTTLINLSQAEPTQALYKGILMSDI